MTPRSIRTAGALLCVLPLFWTACGGDESPAPAPPKAAPKAAAPEAPTQAAAPAAPTAPDFADTDWQLVAIEAVGGNAIAPTAEAVPTIRFGSKASADGVLRMTGFGGCNRFLGNYTASEANDLSIPEPLGSTRMACPQPLMELEDAFLKALGSATRYSVEGDTLIVLFSEGALRFTGG